MKIRVPVLLSSGENIQIEPDMRNYLLPAFWESDFGKTRKRELYQQLLLSETIRLSLGETIELPYSITIPTKDGNVANEVLKIIAFSKVYKYAISDQAISCLFERLG